MNICNVFFSLWKCRFQVQRCVRYMNQTIGLHFLEGCMFSNSVRGWAMFHAWLTRDWRKKSVQNCFEVYPSVSLLSAEDFHFLKKLLDFGWLLQVERFSWLPWLHTQQATIVLLCPVFFINFFWFLNIHIVIVCKLFHKSAGDLIKYGVWKLWLFNALGCIPACY